MILAHIEKNVNNLHERQYLIIKHFNLIFY